MSEINLPDLTYDELIQRIILGLRKCDRLEIIIEKDTEFQDHYDIWINDDPYSGGNIRDILETLAEFECNET